MALSLRNLTAPAYLNTGAATVSIPAVAAGSILIVAFTEGGTPGGTIASLTDSAGDTFTQATGAYAGNILDAGATADVWYCLAPAAGTSSISFTAGYNPCVWIYEIAGGPLELDDAENSGASASAAPSTTCVGPVLAGEPSSTFYLAAIGADQSVSLVSSPWTLGPIIHGDATAYYIGTGSQQATFTQGPAAGGYVIAGVSFRSPSSCGPPTISNMILDLCERAGIDSSLVDVSRVTASALAPAGEPAGYLIERPTQAVSALREICKAFFIDACESSGMLRFVPRFSQSVMTSIPETDLGLASDKAELTEQFAQENDLPEAVTTLYYDATLNYEQGKQMKARNPRIITIATRSQESLSLPFVLTPDQARQIAEATLYAAWLNRTSYEIRLFRALYLVLDPADFINFVYQGQTVTGRLVSSNLGQTGTAELSVVIEDLRTYLSSVAGGKDSGYVPPTSRQTATTLAWLFDIPLLRDNDANPGGSGFYVAMSSASKNWPGGVLYESSDNASFDQVLADNVPASFGSAVNALGAPRSPWTWDMVNTLTVSMSVGAPTGDSDLNVLNGSNALVLGDEIIQFVNAVENPDGTYTLSRLLRGRRGTEGSCGSHAVGDSVVLPLAGGVLRRAAPSADIGALRYYRAVSAGSDVTSVASQEFDLAGEDLMPYAPAGVGGYVDTAGNIVITWVRRTRIGGAWLDGNGVVPLSEGSELYDVEILDGSGAVKTSLLSLPTPTAIYTHAQQITDWGSPPASVNVRVYQKSAVVGRGFVAHGTAPTPGGWSPPWPAVLPPAGSGGGGGYLINGN